MTFEDADSRIDGDDDGIELLATLERRDFVVALERAESDAAAAAGVRDAMARWAARLLPILDTDPHMSVAEALERYRDAGVERAPFAGER